LTYVNEAMAGTDSLAVIDKRPEDRVSL
jgi:hypothetical protein